MNAAPSGGMCLNYFVTNPYDWTPVSLVVTFEICSLHGDINQIWGGSTQAEFKTGNKDKYIAIVIWFPTLTKNTPAQIGGLCLTFYDQNVFNLSNDLRIGVDFKSTLISQVISSTLPICGDDSCSAGEASSRLCEIDCNPMNC